MTTTASGTSFERTPNFKALCERFKRMEIEQPDAAIVGLQPFLRAVGNDLRFYADVNPLVCTREQVNSETFQMQAEVEAVRDGLLLGFYTDDQLKMLEVWSAAAMKVVESSCQAFDEWMAKYLYSEHLLN